MSLMIRMSSAASGSCPTRQPVFKVHYEQSDFDIRFLGWSKRGRREHEAKQENFAEQIVVSPGRLYYVSADYCFH
jgi:hypothetical protein